MTALIDAFTRSNESPIASGWAGPTRPTGQQLRVVSNQAAAVAADPTNSTHSYWNTSFNADQEAYLEVPTLPTSTNGVSVTCRINLPNNAGVDFYQWTYTVGTGWRLFWVNDNGYSQLGSTVASPAMSAGDALMLRVVRGRLRGMARISGLWQEIMNVADTAISAGGYIGAEITDTTARGDNFGGGNLVPSTPSQVLPIVFGVGAIAAGTGAISPGLPPGVAAGDLLIMFLETNNQAITVSGWTQAPSSPQSDATDPTRLTIFYKIATGGADATTTSDSGDHQVGRIIGILKDTFDATTPFNTSAGTTEGTSDTTGSIPGATTTRANCLIVAACSSGRDAIATNNFSAWANASLTFLTEEIDNTDTAGLGGGIGVMTGYYAGPGTYNATTVTYSVASRKGLISLAVQPPSSATNWSGALTATYTFTKDVAGRRVKLGAMALTVTFSAAVAAKIHAKGSTASTYTFTKAIAGFKTTRTSTASTYTFSATHVGRVTARAATASTYTFTKDVAGIKKRMGATASTYTFSANHVGKVTARTQTASVYTFTKDVAARRVKLGATTSTYTFTKAVAGFKTARASTASTYTFLATHAGRITARAATASTYTFVKDVAGIKKRMGATTSTYTFSASHVGRIAARSSTASTYVFGKEVAGSRTRLGATTSTYTFSKAVGAGVVTAKGSTATSITFTKAVAGARVKLGSTASTYTFSKDVAGRRTRLGVTTSTYTLNRDTVGRIHAKAATSSNYTFTKDVAARRVRLGATTSTYTFTKDVAGSRKTFGAVALPVTFNREVTARIGAKSSTSTVWTFVKSVEGSNSSGLATVGSTLLTPFAIRNAVGSARLTPYYIRATVGDSRLLPSTRREAIGATIYLPTIVRVTAGASLRLVYGVRLSVGTSRLVPFGIFASAGRSLRLVFGWPSAPLDPSPTGRVRSEGDDGHLRTRGHRGRVMSRGRSGKV